MVVDEKDAGPTEPTAKPKKPSVITPHQCRAITKRKSEPQLPMPFELPLNYPFKVSIGLDNKNLVGKSYSKFISSIAGSAYRFKKYPTKEEYDHVAYQIVEKYPFLKSSNGTGIVSYGSRHVL